MSSSYTTNRTIQPMKSKFQEWVIWVCEAIREGRRLGIVRCKTSAEAVFAFSVDRSQDGGINNPIIGNSLNTFLFLV